MLHAVACWLGLRLLRGETAQLPWSSLQNIPYLEALTSRRWAPNKDSFELPDQQEFKELSLVVELVRLLRTTRLLIAMVVHPAWSDWLI